MNDKQFNTIMQVLAHITGQLDEHSARLDRIESRLDAVELRLDAVEKRLNAIEQKYETLEQRVTTLETTVKEGYETISTMHADVIDRCDKNHADSDKRLRRLELKRA